MRTFEWADSYGFTIQDACEPTAEELVGYRAECAGRLLFSINPETQIKLDHFSCQDLIDFDLGIATRFFQGCGNRAWIIDEEMEKKLVARDAVNRAQIEKMNRDERIHELEHYIARAETVIAHRGRLMTAQEITVAAKRYNDINNEGGEGYVPSYISAEGYATAKTELLELQHAGATK